MTQEETIQWKGVAAIAESFKWKGVILVHEDSEFGRESVAYVIESFQEKNIHISYKSAVSLSATDDHIVDELRKLSDLQETIFIIHVPHSIAYRLLVYAKRMGLMTQGYAWIVTDKTMNFFDPVELDVEVLEAFQGVLGLRYFIPSSNQFHNFSRRWRRESLFSNPNIFNALAYDAIFAVAMAVERVEIRHSKNRKKTDVGMSMNFRNIRVSESQMLVFKELLSVRFNGLSGEFHFVNRKSMAMPLEIVNVIGKGERSVGFWTEEDGITMYLKSKPNQHPYSISGLERVIWPGESMIPPRRLILQTRKELRIGVPMHTGFDELLSVEHNPHTNATIAKGFCVDVFNAALDALPYKVPYVFVPFSMARRPNSESYNQLIYQVYLQNYDAVVGDTTITANRSLYVDFTIPYTDLGVGTVARDNHNQRKLWWFLEPLDTHMWVATTCSFFIIGATIWVIEYPINTTFQGPWQEVVGNVLWFSFSTLTYSHTKLLSNLSKLLVTVWLFIVLILVTSYSAALSSMLTVQQIQLTRRGINIGYQAGSFIEGVIVNNSNFKDPSLRSYYSLAEYARALEGGNKNGGVVAIMDEIPYLKLLLAKYGNAYHLVSYEPSTNGFGFVFPRGSPLVSDISREILRLRQEGELLKLEKKWFQKDSSFIPQDSQVVNPTILTLHNFRGLYLIGGIILALVPLVFLLRHVYTSSFLK
ncbi:putative periplasmic binding protein-like I [Helianthus annuus]|uniref:Periplasmic binding protein-like I n=1 Tax=Helianthus annuus TaxID=4232 RepID=A0A251S3N9_HELAN|nr:putative periplasmic binding protein-like I [Helianthus annuus]KAJ0622615.1 putative periplasmic binding protein-like I [Helianthus annuus]KAJ0626863.1 putative periplasmic binding protein-like I [Helianthus annuus]